MAKVYEVHTGNNKQHWVIANSKKAIKEFFFSKKVKIFLRKDVQPTEFMLTI